MLHEPAQQFQPSTSPSRVAVLVAEYERWHALYNQAGDQQEALPKGDTEGLKAAELADAHAVRRMNQILKELMATRVRSLRDLGLKARVAQRDNDELATALLIELMDVSDVAPITKRDFEPSELLSSFVEPARIPVTPPTLAFARFDVEGTPSCRVADLARRSRHFLNHLDQIERRREGDEGKRDKAVETGNTLMSGLAASAIYEQAKSAEGALFQVIAAYDLAVMRALDGSSLEQKQEISLLLWSVRYFLEAHFGIDGRDFAGDYWMPPRCNPIVAFKDAAAAPEVAPSILQAAE